MATPIVESVALTDSSGSSGSDYNVNLPAGIVAGDLILCALSINNTTSTPITIPSGYSLLYSEVSETFITGVVFYKVAEGSEGSQAVVGFNANNQAVARSYRISGFSGVPEVEVLAIGNSTTNLPPTITPSGGESDYLYLVFDHVDTYTANVTGYPNGYVNTGTEQSATGAACRIAWGEKPTTATTSETPSAFTLSATRRTVTSTIAIAGAGGGGGPEVYNFSASINQTVALTGTKNKNVNVAALLTQNPQNQALTNKKINYSANVNQTVNLNSTVNKSANLNSVIAQKYKTQATANKQTNANGEIKQTILLTGYFTNSLIESHEFSATITINPTISAATKKQANVSSHVMQSATLAAAATKTATVQSNCFYQVSLNAQNTKKINISGHIKQTVAINALFINTATPIHLRQFRIDGQIVFQRFNGAIVTQRFNGALK